jgi:hypothetical protein
MACSVYGFDASENAAVLLAMNLKILLAQGESS